MDMAGIGTAIAIRPGEHACCRLARSKDRERLALAFVRAGLQRGEKVLYFAARQGDGSFDPQLARDGGFASALSSGQLTVRDARDVYTPDGSFDAQRVLDAVYAEHRNALSDGYTGLSVTGEMWWALDHAAGSQDLSAYERGYGQRTAFGTLAVFCQYDHGRFAAGTLRDVAAAHGVDVSPELEAIGRDGGYLAAARVGAGADAILRLSGDLDLDSADSLAGVLGAHFHGTLRLDLMDLDFVDVAGMRALRGRIGQPLEIVAASAAVHRLLALLGWDTDPDVEVRPAAAVVHA